MNTHATDEPSQRAVSELHLGRAWRPDAIRELVKQKTSAGRKPAFLFLGKHEAGLLREHLGTNFGPESVRSLRNLYYQGMEVIELDWSTTVSEDFEIMDSVQKGMRSRGYNPGPLITDPSGVATVHSEDTVPHLHGILREALAGRV